VEADPIAVILKFGFLAVLYLFLLWVTRSSLRDLVRADDAPARGPARHDPLDGGGRSGSGPDPRMSNPRLVVIQASGRKSGAALELRDGSTLGRTDAADVKVEDRYASSSHARIFARGDHLFVEDLGSNNGTFLNGKTLERPEQLESGDTIRIGDSEYRYQE
jgi:hypothetical protein